MCVCVLVLPYFIVPQNVCSRLILNPLLPALEATLVAFIGEMFRNQDLGISMLAVGGVSASFSGQS